MRVDRFLELLEENGITQRELANKIGMSEISISRYVSEHREPRTDILGKMADLLGTSTDYLLGRTDYKGRGVLVDSVMPHLKDVQDIMKNPQFTYNYTQEDADLGLSADWIEHLKFLRRAGAHLTREEMEPIIAAGRLFAARVEKELREKEEKGKE